jgi:hypothetical protein
VSQRRAKKPKLEKFHYPPVDHVFTSEPTSESGHVEAPFMHVDDFIDAYNTDAYASFVLALFRFPAVLANKCFCQIERYQLFCKYKGRGYRVTGCSRMGDVWLSADYARTAGYELRVNVADCSQWSPNRP